jgi:hypothetical protein
MKIELFIKKLQEIQKDNPGIHVAIMDWRKNLGADIGDGSSEGIYQYIEISLEKLDSVEAKYFKERNGVNHIPFVALSFQSDDYNENGDCLI